jgi:hypothetical protein
VGRNVTLKLTNNIWLKGNGRNTNALLTVNDGGTLIIGQNPSDKTYITLNGSEDERSGGAITVNKGGELIMNGGDIYQCTVHARPYDDPNGWPGGGGVNVRGGTFTMTGGNIERCFGQINGGAVLVDLRGRFIMTGGQLYDNSAPYGGGVATYRGGLFILDGGIVKENLAREGGAVFVDSGAEDAIPYDPRRPVNYEGMAFDPTKTVDLLTNWPNMAGDVWHPIHNPLGKPENDIRKQEGFYMKSGTIHENHALSDGGGIYNYAGGIVYMTGGTLSGNIADDFGGGVMNMGLYIMINGNIQANRAAYGAGVMAGLNQFAFEAGNITGNQATSAGAGVFVLEGTFSMLGANALIENNIARVFGGGVAIYPTGVFAMAGGIIGSNSDQNYNEGNIGFFDSSDPKLHGYAIYGKRPDNFTPGDPLIDHGGRFVKNPAHPDGADEWLIETYLVRFKRSSSTNLVYDLEPWLQANNISVTNGVLTVTGISGGFTRDMNYQQPLTN